MRTSSLLARAAAGCLATVMLLQTVRAAATPLYKRYVTERDQVTYHVVENEARGAKLEFVHNSGICETTPGVNSYSGYLSVGENMNMFFWFFEARHNADQAPLVAWFNGGPGASSMQGLFKSHGPCQFYNGDQEPSLNPHSYNEFANIIYIDQPIGTGFSYGSGCCNSTETAAVYVWEFLQVFYATFSEFTGREFGIFAQSYGGRYAPVFADYILTQNAAITQGALSTAAATPINLVALGLNDGIFDPAIWYRSWIDYSAVNRYRPLANASLVSELTAYYDTECKPRLDACYATGFVADCAGAMNPCQAISTKVTTANAVEPFSRNDIRQAVDGIFPPETYAAYLYREDVQRAIGARKNYTLRAIDVLLNVTGSGDFSRRSSTYIPGLLDAGVKVIIYTGDADWTCNWISNKREAESIVWPGQAEFTAKELAPYTVDGVEKGLIKTVENLSYMKVYESGHDLAYFQPELALQVMRQLFGGSFVST
ncbi:putative carboxypeptidase S1 [Microdochium trichocladiopsis]|uniref:Carboxypeptidase S1 n=1 Tax=Microdochium trichocladiopsis TaxID=1682393 RepID=A0A9P9BJE6_9PEZI|nr:putative carboxypeptidase S1 [Microdochium trichocladiopsis]KAH7018015.1 putative carboxypeptidase S1 [Microdochium trichocladiopsis]